MVRPHMVQNTGSTARDFCMLERNILSHFKLALLLSLLSSSLLLHARLVPGNQDQSNSSGLPLASIEFAAAIACVVAGVWEYCGGYLDLRSTKAFLAAAKPHFIIMGSVTGVIFGTCIVLLVQEG